MKKLKFRRQNKILKTRLQIILKYIKNSLELILKNFPKRLFFLRILIFIMISLWILSGWPHIQKVYAASPAVQSRSVGTDTSSDLTVTLSGTPDDGDLYIIFLQDGSSLGTWSQSGGTSGWTEMYDSSGGSVYYKQIGASESNPSFTWTGGGRAGYSVMEITGHEDPATQAPEVSSGATGSSNSPDPDTVTPTGGSKDYLYIAVDGNTDGRRTVNAAPSGFSNLNAFSTGGGGGGATGATAELQETSSSQNPGTFSLSGSSPWEARTIVVHPGIAAGSLSVDIVDSGGSPVSSPSMVMVTANFSFPFQTATGTFGVSSEKIRVTNTTASAEWTLTFAADAGATAFWDSADTDYDFNDSTASAGDGGDTDSLGGEMTIDPTTSGTITPGGGCTSTGLTLGSSDSFDEGVTDSITILTAGATADTDCYWDLTGVGVSQTIPPEQPIASDYNIDMTVTITAI